MAGQEPRHSRRRDRCHVACLEGVLPVAGVGEAEELLRRPFEDDEAVDELQREDRGGLQLEGLSEVPLLSSQGLRA